MPDDQTPKPTGLVIPAEIQEKFGELIELITHSESMNDEERQYWINLLPVMTPEQVQNLKDILDNERKQLQAIDEKYASEVEKIGAEQSVAKMDEERKQKKAVRQSAEESAESEEEKTAEDILKQIEQ